MSDAATRPSEDSATQLAAWLRRHLAQHVDRVALGIYCAGQGLRLDQVVSPTAPAQETVDALVDALVDAAQAAPQGDALLSFAAGLITEEILNDGEAVAALSAQVQAVALARGLTSSLTPPGEAAPPRPPLFCQQLLQPTLTPLHAPTASDKNGGVPGRDAEMGTLDWAWQEGARVLALTGPQGCGKSTLLRHWLEARGLVDPRRWSALGVDGLFVWSFTADPDVGSFLRAAADYVEGRPPLQRRPMGDEDARAADLERLRQCLERKGGHVLLVLDGLERYQITPRDADLAAVPSLGQSSASTEAERAALPGGPLAESVGELWEPSLRALLCGLAAVDGEAALICTLDREVPSLQPWRGTGYVVASVAPLRPEAGGQLLRRCGVQRGNDSDCERRSMEHRGHALALELLGRFLGVYYGGDARAVTLRELPPADDFGLLPESPTLGRILKAQVQALTDRQRGLLELCVILPGPLSLTSLLALSGVAREHPEGGVLPVEQVLAPLRCPAPKDDDPTYYVRDLRGQLASLGRLGLIQLYETDPHAAGEGEGLLLDLHPLLRRLLYRSWLDSRGGRSSSSQSPFDDALPRPTDSAALDLLEQLVLVVLQAGLISEAHDLLAYRMGGYRHLGRTAGELKRLLGVLRILSPVLVMVTEGDPLWTRRCSRTLAWEAAVLCDLGQMGAALAVCEGRPGEDPGKVASMGASAVTWRIEAYLKLGQLRTARDLAIQALQNARSVATRVLAAVQQARVLLLLGDTALAKLCLAEAELLLREQPGARCEYNGMRVRDLVELERARLALRLSDVAAARRILGPAQAQARREGHGRDMAQLDLLLGEIARRERDQLDAAQAVHRALAWGSRSGDVEVLVRAGLCHALIRMDAGNLDGAATAIGLALPQAVELNLGLERIDLLLARGHLLLRRGDVLAAESDARDALAYACAPDCGYLWGEADALHLLAMVLLAQRPAGSRALEAATHLTDEVELRENLGDTRAREVKWLLARLVA